MGRSRVTFCVGMLLLVALIVAACGGSGSSSSATNGGTEEGAGGSSVEGSTIAYVTGVVGDPYWVTTKCGIEAAAAERGASVESSGPAGADVSEEVQALNATAVNQPDGVVLGPFSPTAFLAPVSKLMGEGVPVAMSGIPLGKGVGYATFSTDFVEGGNSLAAVIGEITEGTGTMGIVALGPGQTNDEERYKSLVEILEKEDPELNVLSPQYAEASTSEAANITTSLIQGNPDMKVIYATDGPQAQGAESAIAAAGDQDKIKLISFDATPQQVQLLEEGKLAATVAQSPFLSGKESAEVILDYIEENGARGGEVPASGKITETPFKILTPKNINSPEAEDFRYVSKCS
jgi:ribose transport system substrate-binding protein